MKMEGEEGEWLPGVRSSGLPAPACKYFTSHAAALLAAAMGNAAGNAPTLECASSHGRLPRANGEPAAAVAEKPSAGQKCKGRRPA